MKKIQLADVLTPQEDRFGSLRWTAAVPIGTNPVILAETCLFAFASACVVWVTLSVGIWVTEGGVYFSEALACLNISGLVFLCIIAGFVGMAAIFFDNRYFATFSMDMNGIYYEGSRGTDAKRTLFFCHIKPRPAVGKITARKTKSKTISWDTINNFQSVPSLRVIFLRRNRWNIIRLYTPDDAKHAEVVRYLKLRLPESG